MSLTFHFKIVGYVMATVISTDINCQIKLAAAGIFEYALVARVVLAIYI